MPRTTISEPTSFSLVPASARLVLAALFAALPTTACTIVDEPIPEPEFRADGCGAGRQKGTTTQTCEYGAVLSLPDIETQDAACPTDEYVECTYSAECFYELLEAASACRSGAPSCPIGPRYTASTTVAIELPDDSLLCDPPDLEGIIALCNANRGGAWRELYEECKANKPNLEREVTCCVDKPCRAPLPGQPAVDCEEAEESGSSSAGDTWGNDDGVPEPCPGGGEPTCAWDPEAGDVACACEGVPSP